MKDCATCKYGYEDEQLGIPMCHHPERFSEDCIDFNMHEEKESEHLADASKTSPNNLEEPVCEELSNETFRIEFKKIEHQCFEEGIVGWQKEKLIARHFYELGLNARKEEIK